MAKYDVIITPFSQTFLDGFFWNFSGRRQIDDGEGTESFASIPDAVFELSRKSGRGGGNMSPPAGRGLTAVTSSRINGPVSEVELRNEYQRAYYNKEKMW